MRVRSHARAHGADRRTERRHAHHARRERLSDQVGAVLGRHAPKYHRRQPATREAGRGRGRSNPGGSGTVDLRRGLRARETIGCSMGARRHGRAPAPTAARSSGCATCEPTLDIHPVTAERWPDLVELFERPGPRGPGPGESCYCMFWRLHDRGEAAFRQRSSRCERRAEQGRRWRSSSWEAAVPGLSIARDWLIGWAVSPRAELVASRARPGCVRRDEKGGLVDLVLLRHRGRDRRRAARRGSRRRSSSGTESRATPCRPAASTRTPVTTRCSPTRARSSSREGARRASGVELCRQAGDDPVRER